MLKKYGLRCVIFIGLLATQLIASYGIAHAGNCLSAVDAAGCQYGLPAEEYQALLSSMQANPGPAVSPISVDEATVKQYSSPGHPASSHTGVLVGGPLPFPMAWVNTRNRPSALPGQEPDAKTPVMPRYTRVYIFATVKVRGYKWYLIGPGQWMQQTYIARMVTAPKPAGVQGRWVAVDLWQQVLTAYQDDQLVFTTLISSGRPSHSTRLGLYHVWIRLQTDDMNGSMGEPDEYALPYVPFVMYFDRGISLHGAYWHDNFGFMQSHGCVNMSVTDAHWLYDWIENTPNLPVYVWTSR
jgi:hypothetical protein